MANLKDKLDRIFSEFIRLRDSDNDGYCRCISCNGIHHWKNMDAGHYVNRSIMSLRYDEKNVNAQCRHCNRFLEGNAIGYNHGLIEKYGDSVTSYLNIKRFNLCKMGKVEYETLIKYYKGKVSELKKEKNIK